MTLLTGLCHSVGESAYRIIPVHPNDLHLLGIQWQGNYFVDITLPFGLPSAP